MLVLVLRLKEAACDPVYADYIAYRKFVSAPMLVLSTNLTKRLQALPSVCVIYLALPSVCVIYKPYRGPL
jgi:hypothetical protein